MSVHVEYLKLLLPAGAYDKAAPQLTVELAAEGKQLDAFQSSVASLLLEIDPRTAVQLLPDWERVYGLPDEGLFSATTIAERQARLTTKVMQTGGLSKHYFQTLLEQAGYTVLIDEPRGFFAGVNTAGERIYDPAKVIWYWRVRLRRNGQIISDADRGQVYAWLQSVKAAYSFVDLED